MKSITLVRLATDWEGPFASPLGCCAQPPCLHGAAAPELSTSVASGSWYLVYLPARPLSALCADRPKIWLPMGLQLIRLCL